MSPRISSARTASLALMALGVSAVLAAGAIGWTGVPRVYAAPTPSEEATSAVHVTMLGVEAGSAIELGPEVTAQGRFAPVAAADMGSKGTDDLLVPAKKRGAFGVTRAPSSGKRGNAKRALAAGGRWLHARASWYGPGFYGNTMAGGGRLRRDSMVVAHRSLKFGTKILFSYKGRSVIAVVRDRGPFVRGRVFDLGPGTARALRFSGVGVVRYRIL